MKLWTRLLKVFGYLWIALWVLLVLAGIGGAIVAVATDGFSKLREASHHANQAYDASSKDEAALAEGTPQFPPGLDELGAAEVLGAVIAMVVLYGILLLPGAGALTLANRLKRVQAGAIRRVLVGEPEITAAAQPEEPLLDAPIGAKAWDQVIDGLVVAYRDVERRSLVVPRITIMPALRAAWAGLKFAFFLYVDLLLFVPMLLVVSIRNLFPGRWRYRFFSWPYLKYGGLWLWRGEAPQSPFIVVRWIVTFLLHMHFESRFRLLRRRLVLADKLSQRERSRLIARVDRELEHWRGPQVATVVFTYGLPVAGFTLELVRALTPGALPAWTGTVVIFLIAYSFVFVATAFITKRGLMMDGKHGAEYFPGAIATGGAYAEEKRLFHAIGLRVTECPFDLLLFYAAIMLGVLFLSGAEVYELAEMPAPPEQQLLLQRVANGVVYSFLVAFAFYRRLQLQRA